MSLFYLVHRREERGTKETGSHSQNRSQLSHQRTSTLGEKIQENVCPDLWEESSGSQSSSPSWAPASGSCPTCSSVNTRLDLHLFLLALSRHPPSLSCGIILSTFCKRQWLQTQPAGPGENPCQVGSVQNTALSSCEHQRAVTRATHVSSRERGSCSYVAPNYRGCQVTGGCGCVILVRASQS